MTSRQRQARTLRAVRKLHRYTGLGLAVLFVIMGLSGLTLGWKKHTGDVLMPSTRRGVNPDVASWLPLDSLQLLAVAALRDRGDSGGSDIDRIDVRPAKGMVKVRFEDRQMEVQLDGATGQVLHIGRRHADWIEAVHDGSIVEVATGLKGGFFKVFYNTLMGGAMLVFTISGFWLWYGPRRMRRTGGRASVKTSSQI